MDTVKDRTKELIDLLPSEDVEVLLKVAERLAGWEATSELLEDKEVMASILFFLVLTSLVKQLI